MLKTAASRPKVAHAASADTLRSFSSTLSSPPQGSDLETFPRADDALCLRSRKGPLSEDWPDLSRLIRPSARPTLASRDRSTFEHPRTVRSLVPRVIVQNAPKKPGQC